MEKSLQEFAENSSENLNQPKSRGSAKLDTAAITAEAKKIYEQSQIIWQKKKSTEDNDYLQQREKELQQEKLEEEEKIRQRTEAIKQDELDKLKAAEKLEETKRQHNSELEALKEKLLIKKQAAELKRTQDRENERIKREQQQASDAILKQRVLERQKLQEIRKKEEEESAQKVAQLEAKRNDILDQVKTRARILKSSLSVKALSSENFSKIAKNQQKVIDEDEVVKTILEKRASEKNLDTVQTETAVPKPTLTSSSDGSEPHKSSRKHRRSGHRRKSLSTSAQFLEENQELTFSENALDTFFNEYDEDNTGFVNIENLKDATIYIFDEFELLDETWDLLLSRGEKQKEDHFTLKEFKRFMTLVTHLFHLFGLADDDNTGFVSKKQLRKVFRQLGYTFDEETVSDWLNFFDTDGIGELDFDKYINIIILLHEMRKQFKAHAKETKNQLNLQEFCGMLPDFGIRPSENKALALIAVGTGDAIDYLRFENYVKVHHFIIFDDPAAGWGF